MRYRHAFIVFQIFKLKNLFKAKNQNWNSDYLYLVPMTQTKYTEIRAWEFNIKQESNQRTNLQKKQIIELTSTLISIPLILFKNLNQSTFTLMRTAIYPQKQMKNHTISMFASGVHQASNHIKKNSSVTKRLEHTIYMNTTQSIKPSRELQYYNYMNEHHNNITLVNGTTANFRKSNNPTRKPTNERVLTQHFVEQYKKIIASLEAYLQIYKFTLNQEIQKHNDYFASLIKVIENQKKKSQLLLKNQIKSLTQMILVKKGVLHTKISVLDQHSIQSYDKEHQELKSQQFMEIPLFKVQYTKIDRFKQQFQKFLFYKITEEDLQNQSNDKESVINDTICLEESIKTEKKERTPLEDITSLQLQQMTPIHHQSQQITHHTKQSKTLQDQDLYCDEDIENILKENKIVRKKRYECRQDPIPQESQSHQDSGILSNIDNIN